MRTRFLGLAEVEAECLRMKGFEPRAGVFCVDVGVVVNAYALPVAQF